MLSSKFKDFILNRKVERKLLELDKRVFVHDLKISSVLIISNSRIEVKEAIKLFNHVFQEQTMTVESIVLISDKAKQNESSYSKKDIGLFGKIKNIELLNQLDKDYDLLIQFSSDDLYLDYLTVNSKAKFKVGNSNSRLSIYNLMFSVRENNISVFITELKKYLKILNKL